MTGRWLISFTLATLLPLVADTVSGGQPAAQPGPHSSGTSSSFRDFRTEGGVVLPEARVVYSTLGKLNASGDNAILLPSHYMANFNGYNWLIRGSDPTACSIRRAIS
jgi:homoserine O-acetyltransferase